MSRAASVKSPRGVSFALAVLSLASKPAGYARTLIIAWAFGTSAGIDAYHLAYGIITLFAGSVGNSLETAVLPELVRLRERGGADGACRSTAAFISCFVAGLAALFAGAVAVAPGVLVKFFAGGFDRERVSAGARMLLWLLPLALITIYRPMLEIWANVRERYTLGSLVSSLFNVAAVPALLVSMPLVGVYGVAFSMSAGHLTVFALFLAALRGVPLRWRARDVDWESVRKICSNSVYLAVILAAGTLYTVVDRYFASGLPVGSVAAISYSSLLIGILTTLASTPMMYFLSLITKYAASDGTKPLEILNGALALAFAYFVPLSAFVAAAARPAVSLIFGWGNFDAASVSMTSVSLAYYGAGFAAGVACGLIYRYALTAGHIVRIAVMTYAAVALNALLDWALVGRFGLTGLALATSVTQITCFAAYYAVIIGAPLGYFLTRSRFFAQFALTLPLAFCAFKTAAWGTLASLISSSALLAFNLFAAERLGLTPMVPPGWRPSRFLSFVTGALKSYAGGK
jgi:peptidoglycan biosynthesis protein MviN/MurJ (putative lipid II flippase)